ncbi:MAG: anaerobic ribonucleoside-triphosphate reductase activating protein [Burkholderiaceae bacterium]|nr:anaerobic ribonucleoside-triphosphate reductase activating protein [Burkholderiaceae bacterium]
MDLELRDSSLDSLRIGAVTRFTTIDYPGCISAVVFIQGCPWNCLYCQNQDLRHRTLEDTSLLIPWAGVENFLQKRQGLIDAVVFSGGEPCLDSALPVAMKRVKDLNYKVGLHTSGVYPNRLKSCLPYLDWVGLDIKAPLSNSILYEKITRCHNVTHKVIASLELILEFGVSYETRCTAHPDYLTNTDLETLTEDLYLKGVKNFALQLYRQPPGLEKELCLKPVKMDYPEKMVLNRMEKLFTHFVVRRN